jgi:hypothetical protein
MATGFLNATQFIYGANKTMCQLAAEISYDQLIRSNEHFKNNHTLFGFFYAANLLLEVPI